MKSEFFYPEQLQKKLVGWLLLNILLFWTGFISFPPSFPFPPAPSLVIPAFSTVIPTFSTVIPAQAGIQFSTGLDDLSAVNRIQAVLDITWIPARVRYAHLAGMTEEENDRIDKT